MNTQQLAAALYRLSVEFEDAEKAGRPTATLANLIHALRMQFAEARIAEKAPVTLPFEQVDSREWFYSGLAAIPQQPKPQVEADGDILFA